jgi:hypothetical protein
VGQIPPKVAAPIEEEEKEGKKKNIPLDWLTD